MGRRHDFRSHLMLLLVAVGLTIVCAGKAQAQLATSFYNVTGITWTKLTNAVQVTIATDGVVQYGYDVSDFQTDGNSFGTTSFRIRMVRARMRIPALVEIGAYPVDSAVVAVGRGPLKRPYGVGRVSATTPMVDVTLRFYVPVTLVRYNVGNFIDPTMSMLGPLQVEVRRGEDRRSIVITVITDRSDPGLADRIRRSKPEQQKHHLLVKSADSVQRCSPDQRLSIDVLHTRLADLLRDVSDQCPLTTLSADADTADVDVSLYLPRANVVDLCMALERGYGLSVNPDPTPVPSPKRRGEVGVSEGDVGSVPETNPSPRRRGEVGVSEGDAPVSYRVSRNGESDVEELPLRYLSPDSARLLFPDYLLPALRVDSEHNELVASGSPALLARLRQDIAILDVPTPQVRVEVQVWEFSSRAAANMALKAARAGNPDAETVSGDVGQMAVAIDKGNQKTFTATLAALESRGRVRLKARPSIVIASGKRANVFLGQQKYITVLQDTGNGISPEAVQIPIGTAISVRPTVGEGDIVTLDVSPSLTTIDAVEVRTGLPTVGTRSYSGTVRLGGGDEMVVAGLDSDLENHRTRGVGPLSHLPLVGWLFDSRRRNRDRQSVLLLIKADRI